MLARDLQLRGKCHMAGERWLVFRIEDEAAVRRTLRRLGHALPPQRIDGRNTDKRKQPTNLAKWVVVQFDDFLP